MDEQKANDLEFPMDCAVNNSNDLLFYNFSDLGAWNEGLQWPNDSNGTDNGVALENEISNNLFVPSMETSLLPSMPDLDSIFNLSNPLSMTPMDNMQTVQSAGPSDPVSESTDANPEEESDEERSTFSYEYIPLSINDWTVPVDAVYVRALVLPF